MSLLLAAGLAAGAPSKPAPLWGGSRQWTAMGINFTSPEVVTATWVFNMYYDDTIRASRWQHLQGQQDYLCGVGSSALTKLGRPCNAIHAVNNFCYIQFPEDNHCCKCNNGDGHGEVEADWLQKEETKYMGTETVNGVQADHWLLQANWTMYGMLPQVHSIPWRRWPCL